MTIRMKILKIVLIISNCFGVLREKDRAVQQMSVSRFQEKDKRGEMITLYDNIK